MRNNRSLFCLGAFLGASWLSACQTEIPKPRKSYAHIQSLGELPSPPKDLNIASNMVSLVQTTGETPVYRTKVNAQIRAGDSMSCEIKAGELVDILAEAGESFLVHVQRSALSAPCENSGEADFVEGYVIKNELEFVSDGTVGTNPDVGNPPANPNTPLVENTCDTVRVGIASQPSSKKSKEPNEVRYKNAGKSKMPVGYWNSKGRGSGSIFSEDVSYFLSVTGKAEKLKVQAFNRTKKKEMPAKSFLTSELKKDSQGNFEIPFENFVEKNSWGGVNVEIVVTPQTAQDADGTKTCLQEIAMQDPLVLDFSGRSSFQTLSLAEAKVRFDLDADGVPEQVGWVSPTNTAFLALDLNANGRIDHGRELFGDATILTAQNKTATDGFVALAQYDLNHDRKIDQKDSVFGKILLWQDSNQNGVSEPEESRPLKNRVDFISLNYVPEKKEKNQKNLANMFTNEVRYSAVFSSKECPRNTCKVYEVFFGSFRQMTALK